MTQEYGGGCWRNKEQIPMLFTEKHNKLIIYLQKLTVDFNI